MRGSEGRRQGRRTPEAFRCPPRCRGVLRLRTALPSWPDAYTRIQVRSRARAYASTHMHTHKRTYARSHAQTQTRARTYTRAYNGTQAFAHAHAHAKRCGDDRCHASLSGLEGCQRGTTRSESGPLSKPCSPPGLPMCHRSHKDARASTKSHAHKIICLIYYFALADPSGNSLRRCVRLCGSRRA